MKIFTDMTDAMCWLLNKQARMDEKGKVGPLLWVSFACPGSYDDADERRERIAYKWAEAYGTRLPPEERARRRQRGLPVAWDASLPVLHQAPQQLVLLSTREALRVHRDSPFAREKWCDRPLEIADLFVMARIPTQDQKLRWTWRIQNRQFTMMSGHITHLIKTDPNGALHCIAGYARIYPLFNGVRCQIQRIIKSAAKLYEARTGKGWPGLQPDQIPFISEFRRMTAVEV